MTDEKMVCSMAERKDECWAASLAQQRADPSVLLKAA